MRDNISFTEKLRNSGIRPTKQRINICEVLFNQKETFHFTIGDLAKMIEEKQNQKISLATVYNTVHAFKEKGYLKEITINSNKCYFDTNTTDHHHFYDEDSGELLDIEKSEVSLNKIPNAPKGKKIKAIDVVVSVATDNHNQ